MILNLQLPASCFSFEYPRLAQASFVKNWIKSAPFQSFKDMKNVYARLSILSAVLVKAHLFCVFFNI